jgi:23S rRNA (uracil1939-C5)-methyltransferase
MKAAHNNKSSQKRPKPRPLAAQVGPLRLGQPGLVASAGRNESNSYLVSAAVPGDRLRVLPQQRSVALTSDLPGPPSEPDTPRRAPQEARSVRLADVVGVVEPSAQRITPPCPVVSRCGGCVIQEMDYAAQLTAKRRALLTALEPLSLSANQVGQVVGLSRPFGYRTKLLMVSSGRAGALRFGFYRRGVTEVTAAEGCAVQHPLTLATLAMVRPLLDSVGIAPTTLGDRQSRGWLHALGIRVSPDQQLSELTLIGRTPNVPGGQQLIERLAQLPGIHGVHLCVLPQRSSYPLSDDIRRLAGARRLPVRVGQTILQVSPATFVQTSAEGADLLAQRVLAALPERSRCLADIYGGAGLFARLALGRYERAVVAESSASAVADLRHYLKREAAPISVVAGRVEQSIGKVLSTNPDTAVLDPPRRGCHPRVLDALASNRVRHLIYVACGIEALVSDGARLLEQGYQISSIEAVDMFPHTTHLEVVARFDCRVEA